MNDAWDIYVEFLLIQVKFKPHWDLFDTKARKKKSKFAEKFCNSLDCTNLQNTCIFSSCQNLLHTKTPRVWSNLHCLNYEKIQKLGHFLHCTNMLATFGKGSFMLLVPVSFHSNKTKPRHPIFRHLLHLIFRSCRQTPAHCLNCTIMLATLERVVWTVRSKSFSPWIVIKWKFT